MICDTHPTISRWIYTGRNASSDVDQSMTGCASTPSQGAASYSFGLWGDMPYKRNGDDPGLNAIIDSLNALPVFRNNSNANQSLGGQNSGGANVNILSADGRKYVHVGSGLGIPTSHGPAKSDWQPNGMACGPLVAIGPPCAADNCV